jgi:hypothetical protein
LQAPPRFPRAARCKFPRVRCSPAGWYAGARLHRYKVGSIEITVVTDGVNRLPVTDEFVTNVKKEE